MLLAYASFRKFKLYKMDVKMYFSIVMSWKKFMLNSHLTLIVIYIQMIMSANFFFKKKKLYELKRVVRDH
jgi:hypothetical protein